MVDVPYCGTTQGDVGLAHDCVGPGSRRQMDPGLVTMSGASVTADRLEPARIRHRMKVLWLRRRALECTSKVSIPVSAGAASEARREERARNSTTRTRRWGSANREGALIGMFARDLS